MLVETDNLVPAEELRKDLDKYLAAARKGRGPIALTRDSEVVGFLISPEEYESMFGAAVRRLLSSRVKGRTVAHAEVVADMKAVIRRAAAKKS